jgi:hypothetical protein
LGQTVNKATPLVSTWPTASAITVGQTLAQATLSGGATSPAGGAFAFDSPTTQPPLGTASHAVTYTPADPANYNTVGGTASVTVGPIVRTSIASGFWSDANTWVPVGAPTAGDLVVIAAGSLPCRSTESIPIIPIRPAPEPHEPIGP